VPVFTSLISESCLNYSWSEDRTRIW